MAAKNVQASQATEAESKNFLRQFRDLKTREFKQISAAQFMDVWNHYDSDGNGFIEDKELDGFLKELVSSVNTTDIGPEKVAIAEAAAILANVKRLEARVKRKEEAREAKRLRELKSEQDKKDNSNGAPDKSFIPDQNHIKANLKNLGKRCKATKRIQRIAHVLHLSDEMAEGLETTLSPFFRF